MPGLVKYLHYKLKAQEYDSIIVKMNETTDFGFTRVLLMDTGNYYKYKLGKTCEYKQNLDGAPTVILDPPYKNIWHVIIEMKSAGEVRASVEIRRRENRP
ncbi:MAG: DUF1883 domain-containing protein [Spirochaetia bacterium]|jgi:hypothetical protein|nr:DUF1883 domain-containing protein [Spirochaetia bacterium]